MILGFVLLSMLYMYICYYLCLNNNFFSFNDKLYKQISGVGTGIKLAPTFACLGLGKFEELVFNSGQDLVNKIVKWKRFIDDVLMLFRGSREQCEELVNWLNGLMPGKVKFKYEYSEHKVEFLDVEIFIENGSTAHSGKMFQPSGTGWST